MTEVPVIPDERTRRVDDTGAPQPVSEHTSATEAECRQHRVFLRATRCVHAAITARTMLFHRGARTRALERTRRLARVRERARELARATRR